MNSIQLKHNMIKMEALETGLPVKLGSPTFIKVKGIARAISDWAREKVRPELRIMPVTYNRVKGDLEKSNYADVSKVRISVPRGLKGHLNAYVEGLFESFLIIENISKDNLVPFSSWLSLKLASPGSMAAVSANRDLKGYTDIPVSKAQSILSGFVDPNSRREAAELDQVYPSLTIMKTTWDNINALTTRYLETNPSKVLKQVNECAEKIDKLIKAIEALPEDQAKLSAQSATVLSGICAQIAEAVDLYGQIGALIREVAVCGARHVVELQSGLKGSATKHVALESLSLGAGVMLQFDGHNVDYDRLINIIDRFGSGGDLIPISELEWVVEEGLTEAVAEPNMSGWENNVVYAVRFEDCLYPVANLNVIGLANAAGHESVRACVINFDDLVAKLSDPTA